MEVTKDEKNNLWYEIERRNGLVIYKLIPGQKLEVRDDKDKTED